MKGLKRVGGRVRLAMEGLGGVLGRLGLGLGAVGRTGGYFTMHTSHNILISFE